MNKIQQSCSPVFKSLGYNSSPYGIPSLLPNFAFKINLKDNICFFFFIGWGSSLIFFVLLMSKVAVLRFIPDSVPRDRMMYLGTICGDQAQTLVHHVQDGCPTCSLWPYKFLDLLKKSRSKSSFQCLLCYSLKVAQEEPSNSLSRRKQCLWCSVLGYQNFITFISLRAFDFISISSVLSVTKMMS